MFEAAVTDETLLQETLESLQAEAQRVRGSRWRRFFIGRERKTRLALVTQQIAELEARLRQGTPLRPGILPSDKQQPVSVVITTSSDFDAFRTRLVSAVRFTSAKHRIVLQLTPDADPRCVELAQCYPQLESEVGGGDMVVVNGATRLLQGWLSRLRDAAYAQRDIATAGDTFCTYYRRDALRALPASGPLLQLSAGWKHAPCSEYAMHPGGVVPSVVLPPDAKPTLMLVVFAGGGGTPKTNADLASELKDHWRIVLLTMAPDEWKLYADRQELATTIFPTLYSLRDPLPACHAATLQAWINDCGAKLVHFRHWVGSAPELVTVAKKTGVPVVVSLHDPYAICPSLSLIDATGSCCLGDCSKHFAETPQGVGDCRSHESWRGQAAGLTLRHGFVNVWRQRVSEALSHADAVVTTNPAIRELLAPTQPAVAQRIVIIEHGRDFAELHSPVADRGTKRLLFLGEATAVKGADFLLQLAQMAPEWEFHFLGKYFLPNQATSSNVTLHDAYERDQLGQRLASIRPALVLLPSRFPETYCHTLSEAWAHGIPVVAHRLGALQERLERHGGGWLAETLQCEHWKSVINQALVEENWNHATTAINRIPRRSIADMAADYQALYTRILRPGQLTD
jgi:glycosyltransferase involved in cell wall biosynthesis